MIIGRLFAAEWSARSPWPDLRQVEQDLIICRALCDLFNAPKLKRRIAFRGGTAIRKLLFRQPLRYSQDIALVQVRAERIGPTIDAIRHALAWLSNCNRDRAGHSRHLTFRFAPEVAPDTTLNVKIEVNTREHVSLFGVRTYPFEVVNGWHQARTEIASFEPQELFGTKLRALLQRRQGRDLFDLSEGLKHLGLNTGKIIACFEHYLELEGQPITRAEAEKRMVVKLTHTLTEDVDPLLPAGVRFSEDDAIEAFGRIWQQLVVRIEGDGWKLTDKAVEELREKKYPKLLRRSPADPGQQVLLGLDHARQDHRDHDRLRDRRGVSGERPDTP